MLFLTRRNLLVSTAMLLSTSLSLAFAASEPATVKAIPKELIGKWNISKVLPTQTISCWDGQQAQTLIGTSITYKNDGFNWNNHQLANQGTTTATVEAQEFVEDNSGSGSVVDFKMLGITQPAVERVTIQHADVEIKGITDQGTVGVPGDNVMIKDKNSLILSVCNVWFEAQRQN